MAKVFFNVEGPGTSCTRVRLPDPGIARIGDWYYYNQECCVHRWRLADTPGGGREWIYKGYRMEKTQECTSGPLDFANLPYRSIQPNDEMVFHATDDDTEGCCGNYFKVAGVELSTGAFLFFHETFPLGDGLAGYKIWEEGTVPAELHLLEVTAKDTVQLMVYLGGVQTALTPTATLHNITDDIDLGEFTVITSSGSYPYEGYIEIEVDHDMTVVARSPDIALSDELIIHLAPVAPRITAIDFGPYPGVQTELKEGDIIDVRVTVENSAAIVNILQEDAAKFTPLTAGANDEAGPGYTYYTGQIEISGEWGLLPAHAQAVDGLGSTHGPFTSVDLLNLNQTYPTIELIEINYPPNQGAIKTGDSADVVVRVTDGDVATYSSPNVTIPSPTTYEETKTVTYLTGDYVTDPNYFVTANRIANDATSSAEFNVLIADGIPRGFITIDYVSPGITIGTDDDGEDYIIRIKGDQMLSAVFNLDSTAGQWQGSWTQDEPDEFIRTLRVFNLDPRGSHYFENMRITNLGGVEGTVLMSGGHYVLAGFREKEVYFPPFTQKAPLGVHIVNTSKVHARYSEAKFELNYQGNTGHVFDGFTIVDSAGNPDPTGNHLWMSDSDFAKANTSGHMVIQIREDE